MTKIEELIDKHSYKSSGQIGLIDLKVLCKEYAEWYAKKCLKIAADKAMVIRTFYSSDPPQIWDVTFEESSYVHVHKDSILNIQLPEHD